MAVVAEAVGGDSSALVGALLTLLMLLASAQRRARATRVRSPRESWPKGRLHAAVASVGPKELRVAAPPGTTVAAGAASGHVPSGASPSPPRPMAVRTPARAWSAHIRRSTVDFPAPDGPRMRPSRQLLAMPDGSIGSVNGSAAPSKR